VFDVGALHSEMILAKRELCPWIERVAPKRDNHGYLSDA